MTHLHPLGQPHHPRILTVKSKTLRRVRAALSRGKLTHHERFMSDQADYWSAERIQWARHGHMSASAIESCRLMQRWTARRAAGWHDKAPNVSFT